MNYNGYDELMSYFHFEFNIYLILLLIIVIGVSRSVYNYFKLQKDPYGRRLQDIAVSFLAVLALAHALFFQGVMSDIPLESGHVWLSKTLYLFIVALVLANLQIVFTVLTDMKLKKLKNAKS